MANNLRLFNTNSEYQSADLILPSVSYVIETDKVIYDMAAPVNTCYEVISTPITSYTPSEYGSVYSFADVKWYMKNNLNNMEEYGIYDVVNDISTATTYEGKLGIVGETEYQFNNGSWSVVGSYVDSSVTYTIDDTDPSPYVGQELSTTFKIPYADVESAGQVNIDIEISDGMETLAIGLNNSGYTQYEYYGDTVAYGTVTNDGEYFYLSLPSEAPQSFVISDVDYWSSTIPIHIIFDSKQATVEYAEKDIPLGKEYTTIADMENDGCPNVGVRQYGVVGNDAYQFDGEDWNSVSNYKVMEKNADGKAYVLVCNSSTDLVKEETQPSYVGNITDVVIGDCVDTIGDMAFMNCSSLTSINIPSGVTTIGGNAFQSCSSLSSVTIPDSVTSIGENAFQQCISLTSVDIPNSVTTIGGSAFGNCSSLTSISIPDTVTSISDSTFYYCSGLTSIDISDSVTSIGDWAFQGCSSLTSCTIGSGITTIGDWAFGDCNSLTSVTVKATTPPTLATFNVFYNTNNCPIYVPSASLEAYKSASGWNSYADRIQAIP